jgi:small conductance mechanosensitive channel
MSLQQLGEQFSWLSPGSWLGALVYLLVFVLAATVLSRLLRSAVHVAMSRRGHLDRTTVAFVQQFGSALIWVGLLILYAHLIPVLRAMGTALLAGASIASVVIGLAAQSTLGNLVAGLSITLYRPFKLGDTLQVTAPTGTESGTVEQISLGYTTLVTADQRRVVLPNSVAASQVTLNIGARVAAPVSLSIRIPRDADLEQACRMAVAAADEAAGANGDAGCAVVGIENELAVLKVRCAAPTGTSPEILRSRLLAGLATRFSAAAPEGVQAASITSA